MNKQVFKKAKQIVDEIYPVNYAGYDDEDANIDELFEDVQTLLDAVKEQLIQKKANAVLRSITNLEKWLIRGTNKNGEEITEEKRKWAEKRISGMREWLKQHSNELKTISMQSDIEAQSDFYNVSEEEIKNHILGFK